ncbi:Hybrid signal transduction histidine kinase D [Fibrisoma limi BUZ 3]|uniref:histidine kinase n=1 Tax=Fibrisoma limi BUZ 3 TaxID=1185876 RepID=I2GGS6_9BACT|nr:two-component regulator propeller domain-containing protein [Fibrisoma limi]CCH53101.1 Hybrid signal transduction histidine kinase D [Fibrisoma limi BUZ 3]
MRVCLLLLLPLSLLAQPKGWQERTISDGLSQGMIYALKQDQKGFIWAGTKDGLNRYDGYTFKVFTHDSYNEYSLSDNNCSALLTDSHGRLWVGTQTGGLNLFDSRTQRFYHLDIFDQATPKAGNYEVWLLAEDPAGNIWVGTDNYRLFRITLPEQLKNNFPNKANFSDQVRISRLSIPETGANAPLHFLTFLPDGRAFVGSVNGAYSFSWRQPGQVRPENPFTGNFREFFSMYADVQNDFWVATTSSSLICRLKGVQKVIPLPRSNYTSVNLRPIDDHTVAVATQDFLWLMSPSELFRQDSLTSRNAFVALPANVYAITNLVRDQTGALWVGTSGYGLRLFNPNVKQFQSYLPNTTLSTIFADRQGRIYLRHEFAYSLLDRSGNRLLPFLSNTLPPADRRQRYLMQDRQGTFWVSNVHFETHVQHLFKFSPNWTLLKKYPLPANTSFGFFGNQTIEDRVGYLWIGGADGNLLRFNPTTEQFRVYSYQSLLPRSGAATETYALYEDGAGVLWIGTQKGLIRARPTQSGLDFSMFKNSVANRQSLTNDFVLSLTDDPYEPNRYLWVGTKGGLERLDKQTGRFDHFTEEQGLPNKVVYGILTDEFKNLWLSTNRGLAHFNPRSLTFRNYTKTDGLQDDEFNTGSFFKTATGELLFGGVNGLTAFRASALNNATGPRSAQRRPVAQIIGLKVNNRTVDPGAADGILKESIEYTQALDLAHDQNLVTFEFGVMDFTNSARNRFRYRLDGIDNDWVEAGTNRFANYAQLPAGSYTLYMIGSADGEAWSQPISLRIRVNPPFYRSWWAYCLYLGLLVVIAWQLYRFQMQRFLLQQQVAFEQKEASRLAELNAVKTRFFTSISHEFRTPLTLILGPLSDLRQRFPNESVLPLMERNGQRLLSLINQLLDLSKLEAGQLSVDPKPGDISAFFRLLASSFESLADSRQIRFQFSQNQDVWWASFDRDKFEKIVTNLLSNAFKFTPAQHEVFLNVSYPDPNKADLLTLTVRDTGIGIPADDLGHIFEQFYQVKADGDRYYEGTGIGLSLVNELVNVLKGTIQVDSIEGVGTTFTVQLPLVALDTPVPAADEPLIHTMADAGPVRIQVTDLGVPADEPLSPTQENSLLIVDDNADIRSYVRSIFASQYQIIEAVDGLDGLEKATKTLPTVVICDLMMPRLDGYGFCKALKAQEATSHIPVVILTAKATIEDRLESLRLEAIDFLTKPFNRDELEVRVWNLMQQQKRLFQYLTLSLSPTTPHLVSPPPLTAEQKFIDRLTDVVAQHLDDSSFGVEELAEVANLSRVQLHRKLKALTNTTPVVFIREIRLRKAAELLTAGQDSVTQVAYAVGFDNLSYFAKVFQERYGVSPSQFARPAATPS